MKPWNKTAARAIPVVVAVVLVAHLAATWAARFPYPFDLEWMEGGMLAHSWRLQHGLPIYTEAGREFIPFIYPAGYSSVLAALGKVFGLGYGLGRAVSLAGTLAAAGAIVRIVRHHGGSALTGLLGAAMFLGCYRFSGAFYDLVRLDGLYIGLLSWAVALGLERRRGALEASALLLAAAFLVKQHCAVFGIPMALGIWTRDGWVAALRFALFAAVPALLVTGLLQWRTDGHYLTYVYSVPALHHLKGLRAFPGTPREAAHALPILLPLAAGWVAVRTARHSGQGGPIVLGVSVALAVAVGVFTASLGYVPGTTRSHPVLLSLVGAGSLGLGTAAAIAGLAGLLWHRRREWRYLYGVGVAGLILVSGALMRAHVGGFLNVHIQMHWVIVLGGTLAVARWQAARPGLVSLWVGGLLLAAQLGYQLAFQQHGKSLVPTSGDRAAGEAVVAELRVQPGPVWSPIAPWLPVQAGHEPSFHIIALWDIDKRGSPAADGVRDVDAAVAAGHWATIVDGSRPLKHGVPAYYRRVGVLPTAGRVFTPKTGWPAKPATIRRPESR
jgi:hypothetical protein